MFARFLILFLYINFSEVSFAENSVLKENSVVNLSHLERSPEGCKLQNLILDCGSQNLVLHSEEYIKKLHIKAARIEFQGVIEVDQLNLETTEDIVIVQGASLLVRESLSINTRGEFRVHGGILALALDLKTSSIRFEESSDVQIRNLKLQTFFFRAQNRLLSEVFRLTLSADLKQKSTSKRSIPLAEFAGFIQAKTLTVLGPATDSQFSVAKSGIVDGGQIQVVTKRYLNLGQMRFGSLRINGEEHKSYGRSSGANFETLADKIYSHDSASYQLKNSQVWGHECIDQGKWNAKNALGFYCQTMTAGEGSLWKAGALNLAGGNFYLDNTMIADELDAQLRTLYTTDASIQKIAKAKVFAKHLLLDGQWKGNEANFSANVIFFGPNANIHIRNLEVLVRKGATNSVRELLNKKSRTEFAVVEKIFTQIFEQEENFRRLMEKSLSGGDFQLERRWKLHQFRNKIYDAFKAKSVAQAAHHIAQLTNEYELHGVSSVAKTDFSDLRQFSFAQKESSSSLPILVLGAINSQHLKMRTDGSVYFDEASKVDVNTALNVQARGNAVVNGSIRAKLIDFFSKSFVLAESGELNATERNNLQIQQRLVLSGLLKSTRDNVLTVKDGDIYVGKSASVNSGSCTMVDATKASYAGKFEGACLRIRVNTFEQDQSSTLNVENLSLDTVSAKLSGEIRSRNIEISSKDHVQFDKTAKVTAKEKINIRTKHLVNQGNIKANKIHVDVKELTAFSDSKLDASDIDIKTISGQLDGILNSDHLKISASGKLQILSDIESTKAKIQAKDLEVTGNIRAKVLELFAENISLLEESNLSADEQLLVKADLQLKVKGLLSSNGSLHLESGRLYFSESEQINSAILAHIKAQHLEADEALQDAQFKKVMETLKNASLKLSQGESLNFDELESDLYGLINSKSLFLDIKNHLQLRQAAQSQGAGSMELSGKIRGKVISLFASDLILLKSGELSAEQTLAIQTELKAKIDGLIESKGQLSLVAEDLTLTKTGKIEAKDIKLKADQFFSEGRIAGLETLIVDVDSSFKNAGVLQSTEDLYIKLASAVTLEQLGKTYSGTWTTLNGEFNSEDVLTLLEGNSGKLNTKKLRIITNKPVIVNRHVDSDFSNDIYAESFDLEKDKELHSKGDFSVHADRAHLQSGSKLKADGSIHLDAKGNIVQESERDSFGNIKASEIHAGASAKIATKGQYLNIGSRLIAQETVVIQADAGVIVVPLIWVETQKKVKKGLFTKKTTIINEEKQQKAKISGEKIKIKTKTDSTLENVEWSGEKDLSSNVHDVHRELKIDKKSFKSFTGAGKLVMTGVSAAASIAGSSLGPAGAMIANLALNYVQSQMLSQKFDFNSAMKQAAIGVLASSMGALAGEYVNAAVGNTPGGAILGGATRGATYYTAQGCMNDACRSFDKNQLGASALSGALYGAITGGTQGGIWEESGKEASVGFLAHASLQGMRGQFINWERASEEGLHAATAYASGRATREWMKSDSSVPANNKKTELEEANTDPVAVDKPESKTVQEKTNSEKALNNQKKINNHKNKKTINPTQTLTEPVEEISKLDQKNNDNPQPEFHASESKLKDKVEDFVDSICFKAGTRVRTEFGWEAIETLREGDTVVTCDFWTQQCVYQAIIRVMESETSSIVHMQVNGETIDVTANHPVYVSDEIREEFVPVGELKVGDKILGLNGDKIVIEDLEIETLSEPITVYNLEVSGVHNYYVSSAEGEPQDLLVHNCNEAKKLGKHAKEFGAGVVLGASESLPGASQHPDRGSDVFETGRATGEIAGGTAQIILGTAEILAGELGIGVSCTVGACAAAPAGVAAVAAGAALAGHGAYEIGEGINQFFSEGKNAGGEVPADKWSREPRTENFAR